MDKETGATQDTALKVKRQVNINGLLLAIISSVQVIVVAYLQDISRTELSECRVTIQLLKQLNPKEP